MARVIKLSSNEARAWRLNQAHWVSETGKILRPVSAEEEASIFPHKTRALGKGRTEELTLDVKYLVTNDSGVRSVVTRQLPVRFVVIRTGNNQDNKLLRIYSGKCSYMTSREIIRKQMLAKHGECRLHGTNGRPLAGGHIRDPKNQRHLFADRRSTPPPEQCTCAGYAGRQPGRHHHSCPFNAKAPPHERALTSRDFDPAPVLSGAEAIAMDDASELPGHSAPRNISPVAAGLPPPRPPGAPPVAVGVAVPTTDAGLPPAAPGAESSSSGLPEGKCLGAESSPIEVETAEEAAAAASGATAPDPAATVYSPEDCPNGCRSWAWPTGVKRTPSEHHPMCLHADGWREAQKGDAAMMIVDLRTARPLRPATPDEIAQSELSEQRLGAPTIEITGDTYAVMPKSAISGPALAKAARGGNPPAVKSVGDRVAMDEERELLDAEGKQRRAEQLSDEQAAQKEADKAARVAARKKEIDDALAASGLPAVDGNEVVVVGADGTRQKMVVEPQQPAAAIDEETELRDAQGLVGDQQDTGELSGSIEL